MGSKRRGWVLGGGAIVIALAAVAIYRMVVTRRESWRDAEALREELRLARAEGMPVTEPEFAATFKPATAAENAAPFYKRLTGHLVDGSEVRALESGLFFHPRANALADAEEFLRRQDAQIKLADQAVLRPRCWFDRDWSKGPAVLFPEYGYMKSVARLLGLRGSVAASEGRSKEALADARAIFAVAKHAREEGLWLSVAVSESIYAFGVQQLALWIYHDPKGSAYAIAMDEAVREWPKPSVQAMHRDEYFNLRWGIDRSLTDKGRAEIGLKPDLNAKLDTVAPILFSRARAEVAIARGERELWEAYGSPAAGRRERIDAARHVIGGALVAYPTALNVYRMLLLPTRDMDAYDEIAESDQLMYVALQRAITRRPIPKSIRTANLRSPFDGKPLRYLFDGRQITITVSCPDPDIDLVPLKFPPEP